MITFTTQVQGIPCKCEVTHYAHACPMRITGTGFGDADPGEFEDFEFTLLDRQGYPAQWLEDKMTGADMERLLAEFKEVRDDA